MGDGRILCEIPRGTDLDAFLEALHVAIRLEEEGLLFYSLNAQRMRNPRGRAAFHIFLREERDHLLRLQSQLAAIHDALRGTPDEGRVGSLPVREVTLNPIFSRGRTLTDRDADEREVLRQGISIQWDTYNFFRERSEAATDPWCRLLYGDFALDERRQYEVLVEAYETIVRAAP